MTFDIATTYNGYGDENHHDIYDWYDDGTHHDNQYYRKRRREPATSLPTKACTNIVESGLPLTQVIAKSNATPLVRDGNAFYMNVPPASR